MRGFLLTKRPSQDQIPFAYIQADRNVSLDGDAFGEVSGLVYVAASADGYVVGEELEGDYFEDG